MQAKINNLKKYIKQMKQERDEAICTTEARQQDINAAFFELERLEGINGFEFFINKSNIGRNFQEDMINDMDMGEY
jgi:hypothetical protein